MELRALSATLWVCACMCAAMGMLLPPVAATYIPESEVMPILRELQANTGFTVRLDGEWVPFSYLWQPDWRSRWTYPGSWLYAYAILGYEDRDNRWYEDMWRSTYFRGVANADGAFARVDFTDERLYYTHTAEQIAVMRARSDDRGARDDREEFWLYNTQLQTRISRGPPGYTGDITAKLRTFDEEPRYFVVPGGWTWFHRTSPAWYLGASASQSRFVRIQNTPVYFLTSSNRAQHASKAGFASVSHASMKGDKWLAPLALASKGRSVLLDTMETDPLAIEGMVCHDARYSPTSTAWPGTPLVRAIAPRIARLAVVEKMQARNYNPYPVGHKQWRSNEWRNDGSAYIGSSTWSTTVFNWEGYGLSATHTGLLACECAFPVWSFGAGCRQLVCDNHPDAVPPDQFWATCIWTLRRMCNWSPVTRRACGPAYDADGNNPSARAVHNPFTNTWDCACDTPFWDDHPGAMGFALTAATPGEGLDTAEEPLCVGGLPCSRFAYCADHVDVSAGFDDHTHQPNAWVNFVGANAAAHVMCNGHGTCGSRGTIQSMNDGSQVMGMCACEGNYIGPGCAQCNTGAGWWGFDFGCTRTCISRSRICHGSGACNSFTGCTCTANSHRDAATRCSTCLLGYVIDPTTCPQLGDGSRDTGDPACRCIQATECMDEDSSLVCAGHGVCTSNTYNPVLQQRCLCNTGWTGFTCAVSTSHCTNIRANRACKFPAAHRQCRRTRLFLWPPNPRATLADAVPALSEAMRTALAALGPATDVDALAVATPLATVAEAWPNSPEANDVVCRLAKLEWEGASLATPEDWERASAHTRSAAIVAMGGIAPSAMWLADTATPGNAFRYHHLSAGRLRGLTPTEAAPDALADTGPALCIRENCQINTAACSRIALHETCSSNELVRVFPVRMYKARNTDILRVCGRFGMVPLVRDRVARNPNRGPTEDSKQLKRAYIDTINDMLGDGTYTKLQQYDYEFNGRTYTHNSNLVVFLTTNNFGPTGEPSHVGATVLSNFVHDARSNQWRARQGSVSSIQGWVFLACSRHCTTSDMWGPDPDCNVVLGRT